VKTGQQSTQPDSWVGGGAAGYGNAAAARSLCVQVQTVTGTNNYANM